MIRGHIQHSVLRASYPRLSNYRIFFIDLRYPISEFSILGYPRDIPKTSKDIHRYPALLRHDLLKKSGLELEKEKKTNEDFLQNIIKTQDKLAQNNEKLEL
jgi:hypothetical protein